MEVQKKYTAIRLGSKTVNRNVEATLDYGDITGPYYAEEHPETEFETEEQAVNYAYNQDESAAWAIIPIITFKTL